MVERAEITLPSSNRPRLMLMPYLSTEPVAPVFFALSEPARSTKKNFAVMVSSSCSLPLPVSTLCLIVILKIAWERELASFINVLAVVLFFPPNSKSENICSASATTSSWMPVSVTDPSFSSRIAMLFWCLYKETLTLDLWYAPKRVDQWSVHYISRWRKPSPLHCFSPSALKLLWISRKQCEGWFQLRWGLRSWRQLCPLWRSYRLSKRNEYCRFVHRRELRHCSHRSNSGLVLVCTVHKLRIAGSPLGRPDRTWSCVILRWPIPHPIGNLYSLFNSSPFRWMDALGWPPSLSPSGRRACPLALPTDPFEL